MKILRDSNENEMILNYLQAELFSSRFQDALLKSLKKFNFKQTLILNGDYLNEIENVKRKKIMKDYRGYPNTQLFQNFPQNIHWKYVEFEKDDIYNIFYINYDYWNDLSNNTSSCLEAAKNIRNGKISYGISKQTFFNGLKYLKKNNFSPIILITSDKNKYLIIEGHLRMTIYGLNPIRFVGTFGFVGICSEKEMIKYDERLI